MVEVNELHRLISQLLAEMELLSEAATAKLQASTGKTKPGTKPPTMDGPALASIWRERFHNHRHDPEAQQRLLTAGRVALEMRRHGPPKIHDTIESEDFILTNYEGIDPRTVAEAETERAATCTPSYVIWLRRRNDRNDLGYPKPPTEGRLRMIKRLQAEGMKQARIARELGISQATVSRALADDRRDNAA